MVWSKNVINLDVKMSSTKCFGINTYTITPLIISICRKKCNIYCHFGDPINVKKRNSLINQVKLLFPHCLTGSTILYVLWL